MELSETTAEYFQREYYGRRRPTEDIAKDFGRSGRAVRYRMAKLGLTLDPGITSRGRPAKSPPPRNGTQPPHPKGPDHPNWKGGRILAPAGYYRTHAPDHPEADVRGYVAEHRLVMERKLGRRLLPGERVHHINHVTTDNRPENLQVMSHGEHIWLHRRYNAGL